MVCAEEDVICLCPYTNQKQESLVVSFLGKYLEMFIRDFRKEQLNISAMQGKVELKNVG